MTGRKSTKRKSIGVAMGIAISTSSRGRIQVHSYKTDTTLSLPVEHVDILIEGLKNLRRKA
jgi:hypothetical protein